MKFKLKKSEHLNKFQLVGKIDKLKLSMRENKSINADSLVFHSIDSKLFAYISNGVSASVLYINECETEFEDFAVDCNSFINAFSNFPTDEVNFVFISDENQLVFGNKKTRVSLKTSKAINIESKIKEEFFINDNVQYSDYDLKSFVNSIKFTSFSCAPDFEEHPYSSIMFFIKNDKFNSQSSDKHRISIYGNDFENEQSFLINKNQADLSLFFVDKMTPKFAIYKNKLIMKNEFDYFCTALELNTFQSVYNGFQKFFESSELITSITLYKNELIKSLKFVSNISGSHLFNIKTQEKSMIITSSGDHTGGAADKIELLEELDELNVSYLTNHFMKILEMLDHDKITLNFYDYNNFIICIVEIPNYKHMMFPMN